MPTLRVRSLQVLRSNQLLLMGLVIGSIIKHTSMCMLSLMGGQKRKKGMYLAVSLRGQAQGVFGNIVSKSHDFT